MLNSNIMLVKVHFFYLFIICTISHFRELLHTKERQRDTLAQLHAVLGESCITCELDLAGPEYECNQGMTSLSPTVAEELFRCEFSDNQSHSQALSPDMTKLKKANVMVDNSLSPAHTLLQIHCADHKGLLYDIMRTLKDCNIQVKIYIFFNKMTLLQLPLSKLWSSTPLVWDPFSPKKGPLVNCGVFNHPTTTSTS